MSGEGTGWVIEEVNTTNLLGIDVSEFTLWKSFPISGLYIMIIFRKKYEEVKDESYFYLCRYYVYESSFEKPKKITKFHKLWDLFYCIEMRSNVLIENESFILFNCENKSICLFDEKDFISL